MEGQVTDFPRSRISAAEFFSVSIELNDAELAVVRGGFTLDFSNFGLNAVGPIRSESEHVNTAVTEHPRSESSGVATNTMPEAALMDEGQVAKDESPINTAMATLEAAMGALRAERDAERERADRAERQVAVLRAKLIVARLAGETARAEMV